MQATVTGASSDRQITEGENYKPGKKAEDGLKRKRGGRNRTQEGDDSRREEEERRRYSPCPIVCPCLEE